MEYHVKRVPLPFFLFFVWILLTLCVKALSIKRSLYIIQMDKSHITTPHNWYLLTVNSLKFSNVVIAILDSGVWPESPSFNDKGMSTEVPSRWKGSCDGGEYFSSSMCNFKIIGARYFNKGIKASMNTTEIHIKDSARDDTGHGTQMASIAASNYVDDILYFGYAKGIAVGVTPQARLASYKVVWNRKGRMSDIYAGFEQAIADIVDVINLSLGHKQKHLYEDALALATFLAMKKGIVVVAAAGNDGPGLGTLQNGIPWILTVTASTIDRWFAGSLVLGNAIIIFGWSMFLGNDQLQNLPLVYDRNLSSCSSQNPKKDIPHGIIMCNPGKVRHQIDFICGSNALGAILVHNDPRIVGFKFFPCPCIVINQEEAKVVISYVKKSASLMVTMNFKQTFTDIKPAPIVLLEASRGPSLTFPSILKPDIMAPGSLVLVASLPTIPISKTRSGKDLYGSYKISSRTSLATPHVSGVVALFKVAYPKWSPAAIKSAIITTTNTLDNTLNPIRDSNFELALPFDIGAGQINPIQALDLGLVYNATLQDFVDLLCSTFSGEQVFSITKHRCINPSFDLNYPSFMSSNIFSKHSLIVQKLKRIVTNVGKGTTTYEAVVVSPRSTTVEVSPKTLVFQRKYEQQSYNMTITYKGNVGGTILNGELLWVDSTKKYRVRSLIMVTP